MNDETRQKIFRKVIPRVDWIRDYYVVERQPEGGTVTDSESFAVDAITDLLIWANVRDAVDIDELCNRAAAAAADELSEAGL